MRRKSPPLRHSAITWASISLASRPETANALLRSHSRIIIFLLAGELRSPKMGSRTSKTFICVWKRAKPPAESRRRYRKLVPERGQPTMKTGGLMDAKIGCEKSATHPPRPMKTGETSVYQRHAGSGLSRVIAADMLD